MARSGINRGALERLGITGAEVYRTDVNGNVTVRIDEDG